MRMIMDKKNQKISITTTGDWEDTVVLINGQEIYCEGINISGNKQVDLDIALVISQSKITDAEVENSLHPPNKLSNAIGFACEDDYMDDDDE